MKLGTHYARYRTMYVILIRSRIDINNKKILPEIFLKQYTEKLTKDTIDKIKIIYVFRDVFCLKKSNDDAIILRKCINNDSIIPVSLMDDYIKLDRLSDIRISTTIPEVSFKKWLYNDSPSQILCSMFRIDKKVLLTKKIFVIKTKMMEMLKRVSNEEYIDLSDIITSRISNKIQFHLEKVKN